MLARVLVANRGEIAVRVIKACRALGIETVLAASAADRDTLGARLADRVVCIGPPPSTRSYLDAGLILHAAQATGCDAVHPGYGFLSEKVELAKACEENNVIFVGPSADTIGKIGDKLIARRMAAAAGVPVVPGSEVVASARQAQLFAADMGYPVMLKAAAGGGGRGVFVARSADEIERSFDTASAEARGAFGDGSLYIERYIGNARHIEVQILGDSHGNAVHLGERDCSLQRRFQKVVEEGPAIILPAELRRRLHEAALRLVRHVAYVNAGTVEFLYDADRRAFHFIEMNARIQVEHPVSEMITGIDIVREQLRIAAGEALSFDQGQVRFTGHAIECRINAECPAQDFRPAPGRISRWRPPAGEWVRLDTHCTDGYLVPPFYDSMIGKLIVHASDRDAAIVRMREALHGFQIGGIETNIDFHKFVIDHPDYRSGCVNTRWLETVLLPAFQARQLH
jgi:acetyl-CoA carboxylase, biotin carboxylase subunit